MKQYTKPVMTITVLDKLHTIDITVSGENDTWGDSDPHDLVEQSDY